MRIGLQDTDWGYIGARLARADDNEQAHFFKKFVKECLSWGTKFQIESQLLAIADKLSTEEKEILQCIVYEHKEDVES